MRRGIVHAVRLEVGLVGDGPFARKESLGLLVLLNEITAATAKRL